MSAFSWVIRVVDETTGMVETCHITCDWVIVEWDVVTPAGIWRG